MARNSVIAVIFHHDKLLHFGALSSLWIYYYGGYGVTIFFAISGLLICSRLLEEERVQGRIHLQKFYIRRAFRILPAAVACLGVIGAVRTCLSDTSDAKENGSRRSSSAGTSTLSAPH